MDLSVHDDALYVIGIGSSSKVSCSPTYGVRLQSNNQESRKNQLETKLEAGRLHKRLHDDTFGKLQALETDNLRY